MDPFQRAQDRRRQHGRRPFRHHRTQTDRAGTGREGGEPILRFLAEQTRGVIEAYHAAFLVAQDPELPVDRKEFFKRAAAQFENAELLGEAQRRESANDSTFQNALDLLVRRGMLEARKTETGKGTKRGVREEVVYARGEHAAALGELTRRLAAALACR